MKRAGFVEKKRKEETAEDDCGGLMSPRSNAGNCSCLPTVVNDGQQSGAIDKLGVTGSSPVPPIQARMVDRIRVNHAGMCVEEVSCVRTVLPSVLPRRSPVESVLADRVEPLLTMSARSDAMGRHRPAQSASVAACHAIARQGWVD